ncbi:hypothetical protein MKY96_32490 [Paenibacillus sp. FSL R7-0302]|uniref:hypothetical protein n=1 Tax=Paenibacillus sp. FSL R7-0302 TaxID=2921681 RepID=UPI0030F93DBC
MDATQQVEMQYDEEKREFYVVPEENMRLLQAKINILNNKAAKLGFPDIELEIVGESEKSERVKDKRQVNIIKYKHVKIIGESPKLNGFRFIATIDHLSDEGNVIRAIESGIVPEQFRTAAPNCEHCNSKRMRNHTYLVQHEDGTIHQIGKSCLKDFLGHKSPEQYARYFGYLMDAMSIAEDCEPVGASGAGKRYMITEEFLETAAELVLRHGFMSKRKCIELYENTGRTVQATSDRALDAMQPDKYSEARGNLVEEVSEEAKQLKQEAYSWLEAVTSDNEELSEYMHNLKTICSAYAVDYRHAAIAASLFGAHFNATNARQKKERQTQLPESNYYGIIGEKADITVRCLKVIQSEGAFGYTYIHLMVDESTGNRFVWNCTNGSKSLSEDVSYNVKGSIKDHNEYNGVKQTVLTRCKATIIEVEGE